MVKLADTLDLGSNAKSVQVQVLSSVPTVRCKLLHRIFRFTKSQLCCAVGGLVRCAVIFFADEGVPSLVPSVMVYKSFLIDHYFFASV